MKNYAADRLRTGDWEVWNDAPPVDPAAQAKYDSANRLIFATFTSPAGRKTLDWMIANFLLGMTKPEDNTSAEYKLGQESVVKQILYFMKQAQGGE